MLRITVVDGDALKILPSCTSTPAWETNNHASGIRKSVRQGVVSPQSPSTGLHCDTDVQRTEGEVVGERLRLRGSTVWYVDWIEDCGLGEYLRLGGPIM
jgi:hypothetical protein